MIELDHVSHIVGGRRIVDGITLTVADGEFCALVGSSGSGKSTTLKMINRLLTASEGTIRIDGKDIATANPEELRRSIGYVIQSIGLFPHWTVADNIATVPRLLHWPAENIARKVDKLLDLLRLDRAEAGKYPHQLSGGQQQRVGVARALAADPKILLMDEPFGALDPITRAALQDELGTIHRRLGQTIIFVTHDIDEALRLADRVAIIDAGKLVQVGTAEEILSDPQSDFVREFVGDPELRRLALKIARDREARAER